MFTRRQSYICIFILTMISQNITEEIPPEKFQSVHDETKKSLRCKWSNENCASDKQCCSGRCVKLHEGTNPRCASSPMHFSCFFSYQCEDGLSCGDQYTCCAPYWGVCTDRNECCDASHVCREEDGFIYNRCLTPSGAPRVSGTCLLLILIVQAHFVMNVWNYIYLQS